MNSKDSDSKKKGHLKQGFTTGAAAAAAAKAALLYLIDSKAVEKVEIRFLNGERKFIEINQLRKLSDNSAQAVVIKDAGDDPDVTHKAEIGAKVSVYYLYADYDDPSISINIKGGEGVGVVTKPGLEIMPGNPAINLGPQTMIREAVNSVLSSKERELEAVCHNIKLISDRDRLSAKDIEFVSDRDQLSEKCKIAVDVEIFVPKGRELAKKTLNSRLGVIGGISILGTTGIVKPMSHDAYIATIKYSVSVAQAMGSDTVVFTTGRRSERVAISLFPQLPEEAFIQIGDFFQASIQTVLSTVPNSIKQIFIVVFFGKAVKMAMGFPHTHAAKSELTMKTLAKWADNLAKESRIVLNRAKEHAIPFDSDSGKYLLSEQIAASNTARHAFGYIYPDYPQLISYVGGKIVESALKFSNEISLNRVKVRAVILDFDGNKIFDSYANLDGSKPNQEIL
ncbi:MAG: cobalt-precorrin-5B (C(1))-methyltransferase [Desulfamplus sp.]